MENVIIIYVIFAIIHFIALSFLLVRDNSLQQDEWWMYAITVILSLILSVIWPLNDIFGIVKCFHDNRKISKGWNTPFHFFSILKTATTHVRWWLYKYFKLKGGWEWEFLKMLRALFSFYSFILFSHSQKYYE